MCCTWHVVRCALRVARCALRVARCALRVARCALRVARCALRVARCALRVARCALCCAGGKYNLNNKDVQTICDVIYSSYSSYVRSSFVFQIRFPCMPYFLLDDKLLASHYKHIFLHTY